MKQKYKNDITANIYELSKTRKRYILKEANKTKHKQRALRKQNKLTKVKRTSSV